MYCMFIEMYMYTIMWVYAYMHQYIDYIYI